GTWRPLQWRVADSMTVVTFVRKPYEGSHSGEWGLGMGIGANAKSPAGAGPWGCATAGWLAVDAERVVVGVNVEVAGEDARWGHLDAELLQVEAQMVAAGAEVHAIDAV